MQLTAYGSQDIYLTGNPQITFFKLVYRRHTNFSMDTHEVTLRGKAGKSGKMYAIISRIGDLVHKMCLQIPVPPLTTPSSRPWKCANPGAAFINEVSIEIGGQKMDSHAGGWLETYAELTELNPTGAVSKDPQNKGFKTLFQRTTGLGGVCNASSVHSTQIVPEKYFYVPLQFWFCRNPGLALPLISLQYHEVKLTLDHIGGMVYESFEKPQLLVDYIYLDTDERRRFAQVSHEYLIEQVQHDSTDVFPYELNFNHPVKEIIWTGKWYKPSDPNPPTAYTGANGSLTGTGIWSLKINGENRFNMDISYFTKLQIMQYHSGPGGLNINFQAHEASLNDSIAVYSFSLKPEEHQPSGTCNFSRIESAQFLCDSLKSRPVEIYAINYNILRIMSGMGGLAYSNS